VKLRAVFSRSRILIVLCSLLCLAPASASAVGPDSVNYQGILTDAGGNPVADANYTVTLKIYDVAVGGVALWSETKIVATSDGLFNTILGSIIPLPTSVFDGPNRFLGTTVSPDPEMTPRTAIVTVPYSHRVSTVDGATGGTIDGNVDVIGDLTAYDAGDPAFEVDVSGSQLSTFGSDGLEQTRIWGVGFGELLLNDNTGNNQTVRLSATTNSGGQLHLNTETGAGSISLLGGASGDASVVFPTDAVNSVEIINEAGVANRIQAGSLLLSGAGTDVLIRTITVPADGYVIAFATGYLDFGHNNDGFSLATIGIVPTGGTLATAPHVDAEVSGNAPAGTYRFPFAITGAFAVNAGANQYTVVGDDESAGSAFVSAAATQLTLLYVPTAYGVFTSNSIETGNDPLESSEEELVKAGTFTANRLAAELSDLRTRLDAIQSQVENQGEIE
jgi:hypothetical protein